MRFQVGDVVIRNTSPSQPEVVQEVGVAVRASDGAEVVMVTTRGHNPAPESRFHHTGMRVMGKV